MGDGHDVAGGGGVWAIVLLPGRRGQGRGQTVHSLSYATRRCDTTI